MTKKARTRFVIGLWITFFVLCWIFMLFAIRKDIKGDQRSIDQRLIEEILVNKYPVWVDSTFQTVQLFKCWKTYPNGQRELLGYKVVVDSSGIRIHEEELVWFLNWAVWEALRLQVKLGKQKGD